MKKKIFTALPNVQISFCTFCSGFIQRPKDGCTYIIKLIKNYKRLTILVTLTPIIFLFISLYFSFIPTSKIIQQCPSILGWSIGIGILNFISWSIFVIWTFIYLIKKEMILKTFNNISIQMNEFHNQYNEDNEMKEDEIKKPLIEEETMISLEETEGLKFIHRNNKIK